MPQLPKLITMGILILPIATITRGGTLPQSESVAQQPGFSGRVSVGYVLVPVVARNRRGYADRLDARDFTIFVDDRRVSVESFDHGASAPVTLLLLQDLSGSIANAGKLSLSRFAIERLLVHTEPGDQWLLASFANDRVTTELPFTSDSDAVLAATRDWRPSGVTALHDAVNELPELGRSVQSSRRAAVVITDGADNASEIDPKAARQKIRESELPVYVLGLSTGSPEILDSSGKKLHRYADVLNLLAHQSGGKYFWVSTYNEVLRACGSISADLRHQYVLGFPTADEGAAAFREIRVTVRKKGVELSHRLGYFGRPPKLSTAPPM